MKAILKKVLIGCLACLIIATKIPAQNGKPELMLRLKYFTENNILQYLKIELQQKADNKLQPSRDVAVQLYLNGINSENRIANVKTDEKGCAQTVIPASLKSAWDYSSNHKFVAVAKTEIGEITTELDIAKSKIEMDTLNADGARLVKARFFAFRNGEWIPEKDVEVKIAVKRLGGSLNIGDKETYTTDSLGQVTAEFKLDSLPAMDRKGNIVLLASIEDNDQFGNLAVEKTVPWGKYYQHVNTFGHRSLWAARFRAPLWLLFMAYSIVVGVWGVIIYLVIQIIRMKRFGGEEDHPVDEKTSSKKLVV